MKKTIIAGGAGFFGSHLCEKPLKHGHEVVSYSKTLVKLIFNLQKGFIYAWLYFDRLPITRKFE